MMVMTEDEIFCRLAKIVAEVAEMPESSVTHEADIADDLAISSLLLVEIIIAAEDKFGVEIPDDALKDLRTVQHVVSYVQRVQSSGICLSVPRDIAPEVTAT